MSNFDQRINKIASKLHSGSKQERLEMAKELDIFANILIDMKEEHDGGGGSCGLYSGFNG